MVNKENKIAEAKRLLDLYNPSKDAVDKLTKTRILVMVAATSAGKNSIKDLLLETGKYSSVITDTTRPKRTNDGVLEQNGDDYWFISEDEFIENIKSKRYLEAAVVHKNHLYGSSLEEFSVALSTGKTPIIEIDIDGCDHLKKYAPLARQIFILPPSYEEWMRRIRHRGPMNEEELNRRLKSAAQEITLALQKPYFTFIVNKDLKQTAQEIDDFMQGIVPSSELQNQVKSLAQKLIEEIRINLK
jgi:guanylate kinase